MTPTRAHSLPRHISVGLASIAMAGVLAAAPPAAATPAVAAAPGTGLSAPSLSAPTAATPRQRRNAVRVAASRAGAPYKYGAAGPWAFDCSGLTMWTYAAVGKRIPRTAQAQYDASLHISRRRARPGDMVFSGGDYKYHVGIYAGNGMMWHAPRTGDNVRLQRIYAKQVAFGRVR